MTLALLVYVIGTLMALNVFIVLLAVVTLAATFICTISVADADGTPKMWKWGIPLAIFLLTTSVLLPSEKTAYTMVGAYAAQKVAEDPKVQQLSGKVLELIESKLDSYIVEQTKPSKK